MYIREIENICRTLFLTKELVALLLIIIIYQRSGKIISKSFNKKLWSPITNSKNMCVNSFGFFLTDANIGLVKNGCVIRKFLQLENYLLTDHSLWCIINELLNLKKNQCFIFEIFRVFFTESTNFKICDVIIDIIVYWLTLFL